MRKAFAIFLTLCSVAVAQQNISTLTPITASGVSSDAQIRFVLDDLAQNDTLQMSLAELKKTGLAITGTNAPEGSVSANVGTLYYRTSGGGAGTTLYVKTSGTSNTGWTAFDDGVVIDSAMLGSSSNPVQNQVAKAYVDATHVGVRLYRDGTLVSNYSASASTASDYGDAIASAFAAAQTGDQIIVSNVYASTANVSASVTGLKLSASGVQVIFVNSVIVPDGNYSALLEIAGNDNVIIGAKVDGEFAANTYYARGIWVTGDRNRLYLCEGSRTDHDSDYFKGVGVWIDGDDVLVDGFVSETPGYAGVTIQGDRPTIRNVYIHDPIGRAANIQNTSAVDWMRFENWHCIADNSSGLCTKNSAGVEQGDTDASPGAYIDFNGTATIGTVFMSNVSTVTTWAWNVADSLHSVKWQNVNEMRMVNCNFRHGVNSAGGTTNMTIVTDGASEQIYLEGCTFSSGFNTFGNNSTKLVARDCYFGKDGANDTEMFYNFYVDDALFDGCVFNLGTTLTKCFDFHASYSASSKFRIYNSTFLANKATDVYVCDDDIATAAKTAFIGNTLTNSGAGDFNIGATATGTNALVATYTPSNVTPDRSFDADSTSTAELADVLGTLITDLQKRGILE